MRSEQSALGEWRQFGIVPLAGALGYATSVIHIYGLSPYFTPLQEAFDWSRAQITVGVTIATLVNGVLAVLVGILVDRLGPRKVGIWGVALTTSAFALLGTSTGSSANWYMLWGVLAFSTLPAQATIWTSAVASRFEVSRGLALAVTLSGAGVAGFVFPVLGTWLIDAYGWRKAFALEGAIWAAVTLPMLLLFFRGARDRQAGPPALVADSSPAITGMSIRDGLRSFVFIRLFVASLLFTFTIVALVLHFFPILTDRGASRADAAGIAALIGIFSIIGRLGTGYLLDRFSASIVGAIAFLLPVFGCLLILFFGTVPVAQVLAAAFIGLTLGSEVDVIVYLTAHHFGLRNFGALYGALLSALSFGTASGPLVAAAVYDQTGNYTAFLVLTIIFMALSSFVLVTLPRNRAAGA